MFLNAKTFQHFRYSVEAETRLQTEQIQTEFFWQTIELVRRKSGCRVNFLIQFSGAQRDVNYSLSPFLMLKIMMP